MTDTIVEETKVVAEKIVAVPIAAGTVLVDGTATLVHDVGKGLVDAADVAVGITKAVLSGGAAEGSEVGGDVEKGVSPAPVVAKPAVGAPSV